MLNNEQVWKLSPVELYKKLDEIFGDDPWLTWEPETLLRTFSGLTDPAMQDKVLAVQAVSGNLNLPLAVSSAFEKTVHAFSNNVCVMDSPQPAYVEEIFYTVRQLEELASLLHSDSLEFTSETPGYVAACGKYYDWVVLPTPLSFAQETLNSLTGLYPTLAKYQLYSDYLKQIENAAAKLDEADLFVGDLDSLDNLPEDSPLTSFIRRIVGCYVFDPTEGDYTH